VQLSRSTQAKRATRYGAAIAAGVGVWVAQGRLADWLTDRLFRRPHGWIARSFYRDAKPHQAAFRETLAALALGPEDRLLEVGCGGGIFLEWAMATGCTAKAIDHSAEMLALAARRNASAITAGRLELHDADAADLPFADAEFTVAATTNAFFFFNAPQAMLAEVYRTLAPGGRIAIHTAATAPSPIAGRMHLYTDGELLRMLEEADYEQIALRRTGQNEQMQLVTARKPSADVPAVGD
jgi:ubiquinone/menaquinone biosynthesis C-methylase UbiE